ncbi:hypothetical protein AN958_09967 [Leucoagaricus sp. SymC.cos]|nr:hypothetical protein AN958_09967 [Leucoagaricus sp. SymC.cos]
MEQENIKDETVFEQWLEEERAYLTGLCKEPVEEAITMDYYQSLVDLAAAEAKVKKILDTFHTENVQNQQMTNQLVPDAVTEPVKRKQKSSPATELRKAEAEHKQCLEHTHALEDMLGLKEPWTKSSPEYQRAAVLHSK